MIGESGLRRNRSADIANALVLSVDVAGNISLPVNPVVEEEPPQSYFGPLLNLSGLNLWLSRVKVYG